MLLGEPAAGDRPRRNVKKVAGLVLLVVVLLGLLVAPDLWKDDEDPPIPDVLADLEASSSEIDRLRDELTGGGTGTGASPGGASAGGYDPDQPLDLDAPLDLGPSTSNPPAPTTAPPATVAPPAPTSEPAIPVPPPTEAVASNPGTSPGPGEASLRRIDLMQVLTAYRAGEFEALIDIGRDASYEEAGRVVALSLAALLPAPEINRALYEVFEAPEEAFPVREACAYGLVQRDPPGFGRYLVRVTERPRVSDGSAAETARLVLLAFYADRDLGQGHALDAAASDLMRAAKEGNRTALSALSFALGADSAPKERVFLLEERAEVPLVAENLLRYYRGRQGAGEDHADRILQLEAALRQKL